LFAFIFFVSIFLPLVRLIHRSPETSQEADMARQTNSQSTNSNTTAVLVGFGLVLLLGTLSQAAWQQTNVPCPVMKFALGTLSSVALQAWQAIQTHTCVEWVFDAAQEGIQRLWPLFMNLASTVS
jgi:uncharacterized membrane protein